MINFIDKLNVPILDLKGKMGSTDYIDFLTEKDICSPLMKGIDCYNRKFLVLHLSIEQLSERTFFQEHSQVIRQTLSKLHIPTDLIDLIVSYNKNMKDHTVVCFHQRYPNESGFVLAGEKREYLGFDQGGAGMIYESDNRFLNIKDLILNFGETIYQRWTNPSKVSTVRLYGGKPPNSPLL
jgi:hypothetical protein